MCSSLRRLNLNNRVFAVEVGQARRGFVANDYDFIACFHGCYSYHLGSALTICFSMPKPRELPAPPNKLDTQADALRNMQARRAGGVMRSDTNVTQGGAGAPTVAAPAAGRTILGG